MSDLEVIEAMLQRAGIVYTLHPTGITQEKASSQTLEMSADDGPHNHGYCGFVAGLLFTADGRLVGMGAWE